jgi:hypothetical protein
MTFKLFPSMPPSFYLGRTLFTNNAQVYYKPHSLAAGGVGGVRNSGHKAKKT